MEKTACGRKCRLAGDFSVVRCVPALLALEQWQIINFELQVWHFCSSKVPHLRFSCTTFAALLYDFYARKVALLRSDVLPNAPFADVFPQKSTRKRPLFFQKCRKLMHNSSYCVYPNESWSWGVGELWSWGVVELWSWGCEKPSAASALGGWCRELHYRDGSVVGLGVGE